MSKLQKDFNEIVKKIEERITDKEELDFIKEQIAGISMLYIDELNKVMDISEKRVNQVYENQRILEEKMLEIEKGMDNIEKELFVGDEYDFEIICPYCNYEFVTDIDSNKKEVECPECHNMIELDWNAEEQEGGEYTGHCCSCEGCENEEDDEEDSCDDDDDM